MNDLEEGKMMPEDAGPSGKRKWIGPILLLSLVLNLFLGALFATGMFHRLGHHGRAGDHIGIPPHHMLIAKSLNEEERAAFRQMMRERFHTLRADFRQVREARLALSRTVGAEPYDPVAVKAAFADLRQAMDIVESKAQSAMVESFASLPAETRARIAENLAKGRGGMRREGRGEQDDVSGETR